MYQLELARSGEALFKIRGEYLTGVVVIGAAIAYFSCASGPLDSAAAIAMLSGSWVYGALTFLISVLVYERISVYDGIS